MWNHISTPPIRLHGTVSVTSSFDLPPIVNSGRTQQGTWGSSTVRQFCSSFHVHSLQWTTKALILLHGAMLGGVAVRKRRTEGIRIKGPDVHATLTFVVSQKMVRHCSFFCPTTLSALWYRHCTSCAVKRTKLWASSVRFTSPQPISLKPF
jgi:hypothetical protein